MGVHVPEAKLAERRERMKQNAAIVATAVIFGCAATYVPHHVRRRTLARLLWTHAPGGRVVDGSISLPALHTVRAYEMAAVPAVAVRPVYLDKSDFELSEAEGGDVFAEREADRDDDARRQIEAEMLGEWRMALSGASPWFGSSVSFGADAKFPATPAEAGALHTSISALVDADAKRLMDDVLAAVADGGLFVVTDRGHGRGPMRVLSNAMGYVTEGLVLQDVTVDRVQALAGREGRLELLEAHASPMGYVTMGFRVHHRDPPAPSTEAEQDGSSQAPHTTR